VAKEVAARPLGEPFNLPVRVWVRFAVPKPKTTKLVQPKPDLDNYLKALLDALTRAGNVWEDDHLVADIRATKVWTDQPTGGTVVTVGLLDGFLDEQPEEPTPRNPETQLQEPQELLDDVPYYPSYFLSYPNLNAP